MLLLWAEYDIALWARNIIGDGAGILDLEAVSATCVGTKFEIVALLHFIFHEGELVVGETNWRNLSNLFFVQPNSAPHARALQFRLPKGALHNKIHIFLRRL